MYILYIHVYIYIRCPLSYYQSTNDLMVTNSCTWAYETENMRSLFVKKEYFKKLVDSEIRKIKFNTRGETNKKNKSKNGVPAVVAYQRRIYNPVEHLR